MNDAEFSPGAVWSELPLGVQAWVKDTLKREGLAPGDWPEVPALRRCLIYAAASVRAERLRHVEGLSRTAAFARCEDDFGLRADTLRVVFWRVVRGVEEAAS